MERSKLAEAQIAFILRHSKDDTAIGEILRKAGISGSMYDDVMPSKMGRLRQLKDENRKLKKVVADLSQYKKMLQDRRRKV